MTLSGDAVSAFFDEMMQDLSEETRKQIDHSVATNQTTKNAMTTVAASFINNRKRKSPDSPASHEDVPASKRTKMEEKMDKMLEELGSNQLSEDLLVSTLPLLQEQQESPTFF